MEQSLQSMTGFATSVTTIIKGDVVMVSKGFDALHIEANKIFAWAKT